MREDKQKFKTYLERIRDHGGPLTPEQTLNELRWFGKVVEHDKRACAVEYVLDTNQRGSAILRNLHGYDNLWKANQFAISVKKGAVGSADWATQFGLDEFGKAAKLSPPAQAGVALAKSALSHVFSAAEKSIEKSLDDCPLAYAKPNITLQQFKDGMRTLANSRLKPEERGEIYDALIQDGSFAQLSDEQKTNYLDRVTTYLSRKLSVAGKTGQEDHVLEEMFDRRGAVDRTNGGPIGRLAEIGGKVDSLNQAAGNLATAFGGLSEELKKPSETKLLAGVLYSELPPEKRRELIERGLVSFASENEKSSELAALQGEIQTNEQCAIRKKLSDACESVDAYLGAADGVVRLAGNLGIDPDLVKAAHEGIRVGSALTKTVQALGTSPPPLGILTAVGILGDLIFGGGPDPVTEGFSQLNERIDHLEKKIDAVDEKLVSLIKAHESTMKALQAIYEEIERLGRLVELQHQQVMSELGAIRDRLVAVQNSLDDLEKKVGLGIRVQCEQALGPVLAGVNFFSDFSDRPHESRAEFVRVHSADLEGIRTFLQQKRNSVPMIFWFEVARATGPGQPGYEILKSAWPKTWASFAGLAAGPRDVDLQGLLERLGLPSVERPAEHLPHLLDCQVLCSFVHLLRQFCSLWPLCSGPGSHLELIRLEDEKGWNEKEIEERQKFGRDCLRWALQLVDLALTQQAILAGHGLLDRLADSYEGKDTTDLLRNNPSMLAPNVAARAVYRRLKAKSVPPGAYAIAVNSRIPAMLAAATGFAESAFRWDGETKNWRLNINDFEVGLPSWEDVKRGTAVTTMETRELLELRGLLTGDLASLELVLGANPAEQEELRLLWCAR
ncbi:MAG: hypothetical protein HYZ53_16030 [Planctomycetes bacterium]|nr:hypothetical protein [Planctomycetota bacterium]